MTAILENTLNASGAALGGTEADVLIAGAGVGRARLGPPTPPCVR
jgi:hypothetical protein